MIEDKVRRPQDRQRSVESSPFIPYVPAMPITLDQVVQEARQWPAERVAELVDRLTLELPSSPEIERAWKTEARRRVADIQRGRVQVISGETVSARIRQIVGR